MTVAGDLPARARKKARFSGLLDFGHLRRAICNGAGDGDELAVEHAEQGRLDEAEREASQALAILEAASGPDHPDVANVLLALGAVHQRRGDKTGAGRFYERAVDIPDHPDTAMTLNNLGVLLAAEGRRDEALALFDRALAVLSDAHRPEHPRARACLENLRKMEPQVHAGARRSGRGI